MKKLIITSLVALVTTTGFASDYIPQEVTSEVFTNQQQVQVTNESYKPCARKQLANTYQYNLKPITVYTGKTVVVKKHYDVYQPKVIYEKVNSYTTTKTCEYCK